MPQLNDLDRIASMHGMNRRELVRLGVLGAGGLMIRSLPAAASTAASAKATMLGYHDRPLEVVRIGFVGVGLQGTSHVENFLKIDGVEIRAVCDIVEDRVARAQQLVIDAGQERPEGYSRGPRDFERLCDRSDLDLVFCSTPWEWHVPVCAAAMENGKHAATEVPMALTVDDCWRLVATSEATRRHCVMMENCNYDRFEMMVLNMVEQGVFGELLHARCGYLHDLRAVKHDMDGEGAWRRAHSMTTNGDLYPTHGLGPVAQCLDINRGNAFSKLSSFGTKTRGLRQYALERFGLESPQADEQFVLSDVVTTVLQTAAGETVVVTHDTSSPRPYSRDYLIQGTRGLAQKYPEPLIYIEGRSDPHKWDPMEKYLEEYDHPVWRRLEEASAGAGHGGMDFIEDFRLVDALRRGRPLDMDVYDGAMLSAVVELSGRSIASGGEPLDFPDFTRGGWKSSRPLEVMRSDPS
jgi:predicted dehydrogenase